MLRFVLPLLAVAALSACANTPAPPGNAALPSGIANTGSAGMTGGSAAAPAGVGAITTVRP